MALSDMNNDVQIVRRDDVGASEGCYVVLGSEPARAVLGYVQVFKDGTAGYWLQPMQPAKPVLSLAEAVTRLRSEVAP